MENRHILASYYIYIYIYIYILHGTTALSAPMPPHYRGFTSTPRHTTFGRTPLDEWLARRRELRLTTHNTHNRQISMPPADSNPQSQQVSTAEPRLSPRGHWDRHILSIHPSVRSSVNPSIHPSIDGWMYSVISQRGTIFATSLSSLNLWPQISCFRCCKQMIIAP